MTTASQVLDLLLATKDNNSTHKYPIRLSTKYRWSRYYNTQDHQLYIHHPQIQLHHRTPPPQHQEAQILQHSTTATTTISSLQQPTQTTPADPSTTSFNSLKPALLELQKLIQRFNTSDSQTDSFHISSVKVSEHSLSMEINPFPSSATS